jgi:hypothetical protein
MAKAPMKPAAKTGARKTAPAAKTTKGKLPPGLAAYMAAKKGSK